MLCLGVIFTDITASSICLDIIYTLGCYGVFPFKLASPFFRYAFVLRVRSFRRKGYVGVNVSCSTIIHSYDLMLVDNAELPSPNLISLVHC